jgi:hypothetical protein
MRISDLYGDLFEAVTNKDIKPEVPAGKNSIKKGLPPSFQHSMPATHSFPDMDAGYGFYRFVVAMAGSPDSNDVDMNIAMRDIPIAVAYTKQEHDMIHAVAEKMGIKPDELAYHGSHELPDTYTTSPVMKFTMPESRARKLLGLIKLSEAMTHAAK